jgi:adenosine deaminase
MATPFQDALIQGDLDAVRRCPKSDLHTHGGLGGNRDFLRERTGRSIEPLDHKLGSMAEMHEWVASNIGPLFDGPDGRLLAYEAALRQAMQDGVTRLVLGDDVWTITLGYGNAGELTRSLAQICNAVAPQLEWIAQLGMSRHCPVDALTRWLAPFLELGVYQAIDLSGDEFAQPIENFRPLYRMANDKGVRLKAHVGEWGSADDVWRAVEVLELHEVQHGIAAADSPAVMRALADNHIRLNVCPTSNVMLGRVAGLQTHPIRKLHDAGIKVTVNSDDVLVFGRSVSDEFLALYRAELFSAAELDEIRLNGLGDG